MNTLHNYLIVFGGHGEHGDFLNDIFIFNSSDNEWYPSQHPGSNP